MDTLILHALRERRRYSSLLHAVPKEMLAAETQTMLAWFAAYWQAYPEAERIEVPELVALIKVRAATAPPDQLALTLHMASKLAEEPPYDSLAGIVNQLTELDLAGRIGAVLAQYQTGGEVDLSYQIQAMCMEARRQLQGGGTDSWADRPIHEYLEADSDEGGLQWLLFPELARNLKGLRSGDNVALAAPTDKGKTSMLCKIAVCMAQQAATMQHDPTYKDRPLLYLVNEGQAERITPRLYQTALGLTRDQLIAMSNAGTLDAAYAKVVGKFGSIRVKNIHGKNVSQIEQIIEHHNPYLVMTDMTGRIKAVSNRSGGANDINQLEEVWNHMRELAAIHNFAHFGTVQVSAEGFEQLHPPISAMQNSKTGIQTTLDLIIMMGAISVSPSLRGIYTPKNKLGKSGRSSVENENRFQAVFESGINKWETGT